MSRDLFIEKWTNQTFARRARRKKIHVTSNQSYRLVHNASPSEADFFSFLCYNTGCEMWQEYFWSGCTSIRIQLSNWLTHGSNSGLLEKLEKGVQNWLLTPQWINGKRFLFLNWEFVAYKFNVNLPRSKWELKLVQSKIMPSSTIF